MKNWIKLLLLLNLSVLQAQYDNGNRIVKNNVHVEVATILFSGKYDVSFEKYIFEVEEMEVFAKISAGGWYSTDLVENFNVGKSISLSLSEFTNISNHRLELSFGAKYGFVSKPNYLKRKIAPVFTIGYRYQKHVRGVIFRSFVCEWGLGIGLGYGF